MPPRVLEQTVSAVGMAGAARSAPSAGGADEESSVAGAGDAGAGAGCCATGLEDG